MINSDRIVPIQRTDLLSLYATILVLANVDLEILKASDVEGDYTLSGGNTYLADQPVKTLDFTATQGRVYFVADFGFEGLTINGAKADYEGEIKKDSSTLYLAELAEGAVTVTAISPTV